MDYFINFGIRRTFFDHDVLSQYELTSHEYFDTTNVEENDVEVPIGDYVWLFDEEVNFSDKLRLFVHPNTTLFYDKKSNRWGVGMKVECKGFDDTPCLLSTFIRLKEGIPSDVAFDSHPHRPGDVDRYEHLQNCRILSEAYDDIGSHYMHRSKKISEFCDELGN